MPIDVEVVGQHRDDVDLLLVLSADGNDDRYRPARETFAQVDPDATWLVFGR